jgi:hypothetical protein
MPRKITNTHIQVALLGVIVLGFGIAYKRYFAMPDGRDENPIIALIFFLSAGAFMLAVMNASKWLDKLFGE